MSQPQTAAAHIPKILAQASTCGKASTTAWVPLGNGNKFTATSARKHLADYKAVEPCLERVLQAGAQFLEDMFNDREPYLFAILGVPGVGKSHMAKLINAFFQTYMRARVDKAISPPGDLWRCAGGFMQWGVALREMLDTRDWTRMGYYRGDYFLVVDDILAESEKQRELSASKLFDILESRHARRWTVVTGNGDLGKIERELDARISSRLIRDGNICITLPPTLKDYALRTVRSGQK
jgi:hypothetical protein